MMALTVRNNSGSSPSHSSATPLDPFFCPSPPELTDLRPSGASLMVAEGCMSVSSNAPAPAPTSNIWLVSS